MIFDGKISFINISVVVKYDCQLSTKPVRIK